MDIDSSDFKVRRIALSIQYQGSAFCGWQRQKSGESVQGVIEKAISELDPHRPIKLVAAGRTDAGVHAAAQVAHFDSSGPIPVHRWTSALNGKLPCSIRVLEAIERPSNWHACHSAKYRRYRYTIYNGCCPNVFLEPLCWHRYKVCIDEILIRNALQGLLGFHDFSAFQRAGSRRAHAYTTVQAVHIERHGDVIEIEIQASGFLYGMVRLLVGQLVALGEHRISLEVFENRWMKGLRSEVKEAAPAKGLCFLRAGYEELLFSKAAWFDCFPKHYLNS